MNEPMELPTLVDYWSIVKDIINITFITDNCERWAQPRWVTDIVSIITIILLFVNIFVITLLIAYRTTKLRNSFYTCAIALFVGEAEILVSSIREADVQQCILRNSATRQLAWQTIGTFGMELTVSVNLTLATVRLITIFLGTREAEVAAKVGVCVSVIWSLLLTVLHQVGLVNKVWFEEEYDYHDQLLVPFNILRIPLLVAEVSLTFIFYVVTIIKMKTGFSLQRESKNRRERRFLIQSLLIFLSELVYLYATFWFGHNYLHIGSAEFNANFNYIMRPIAAGLTPVYYLIFSSEIRQLVVSTFRWRRNTSSVTVFTRSNSKNANS
ncbi:hypothetical protein Y032_0167g97 [Ancylostoma ceylanicum]|uniref:G-protein coupled receptors family 1 profile domain-containing protein n=1 Tax=Ancylostoma ceylanicum TaxID=53326 RepID=A0A016SVV0_9BILA|nr:hypothetical protein Y032_0167g97 [Ancylostoma ceylanicum]